MKPNPFYKGAFVIAILLGDTITIRRGHIARAEEPDKVVFKTKEPLPGTTSNEKVFNVDDPNLVLMAMGRCMADNQVVLHDHFENVYDAKKIDQIYLALRDSFNGPPYNECAGASLEDMMRRQRICAI